MGIKNPYMNMLASFAVNKGVSYLGGKAFDAFSGTSMGQSVVGYGNTISNAYRSVAPTWAGGYDAATLADLQLGQAMTANAGGTAAGVSPVVTGFEAITPYLPYIPAFVALMKGDVGAAAGYAVGAYAGAALGTQLASIGSAAGPIGAIAGFVIGSVLAKFLGKKKRQPNPAVWRIIRVSDNNNINLIVDLQAPRESPPKEFNELCDSLLRVGFNATKAAEVATKKPIPFDFLMCTMDVRGVYFSLRKGDPTSADFKAIALGAPDKSFSAGKAASQIVKLVTDTFKEAYAADATAIDKVTKDLNKKTYKEISTGLTKELNKGTGKLATGKLDTTVERGVFGATAAQDAIITTGMANKPQAATDGGEYSSGTPPMVYSMKEGKYVETPSKEETITQVGEDGTYQVKRKVYDTSVLMLDKDGNPIYDKNNSGGIDLADIVKPTLTATSGTITSGTTTATNTTGTTGTTGAVTVNTVADNSQKNNQSINTYYANTLSKTKNPIRDAMLQTGMPA